MGLVDIGANLTHSSFEQDFEEVITRARAAGLAHIILTGTDLDSSEAACRMALARPGFFSSTAGFHPHIASAVTEAQLEAAAELALDGKVVAIGETGLDFNRNYSPREDQLRVFEQHLQLAARIPKPLFLHQRDAHGEFLALLKQYRSRISGGVVHCFTGTPAMLRDYLALDMYIGVTGWICDERRAGGLREAVGAIPLDRLLIETDAPYLLPRTLKPKPGTRRNEPAHLPEVARGVARYSGRDLEEIVESTAANAIRLFGLPALP